MFSSHTFPAPLACTSPGQCTLCACPTQVSDLEGVQAELRRVQLQLSDVPGLRSQLDDARQQLMDMDRCGAEAAMGGARAGYKCTAYTSAATGASMYGLLGRLLHARCHARLQRTAAPAHVGSKSMCFYAFA